MNEYFQNYIENGYHFYFVSPHFDDAALSCGAFISYLAKSVKVTVVNVFTKGGQKPYTLSAKALLKKCGYKDADKFYDDRKKEDEDALKKVGVETINLDFLDAPWRKRPSIGVAKRVMGKIIPEIIHTYPVYRTLIKKGIISKYDNKIVEELENRLSGLITEKSVVFCPQSTSVHSDHTIVNKACTKLFKNIVYWSDYPYSLKREPEVPQDYTIFTYLGSYSTKKNVVMTYKSQMKLLFPDGKIPEVPEKYFYKLFI